MSAEPQSDRSVPDWIIAVAVGGVAACVAWSIVTNLFGWGDDFAAYLLQARAIDHGALRAEVLLAGRLLALSDAPVGPPAAPWGLPAILWLASKVVGWNLIKLKIVSVLANGVLGGSVYLLARSYFSRLGSAAAAAFVALQPAVLATCDSVGSDVPGLAVMAIALVVSESFARAPADGDRVRYGSIVAASLLVVAAYSVRSNGAFVAVSMFAVLAVAALSATPQRRRILAIEMVTLTLLTAVLIVVYLRVLPDASLAHVSYLTLAPEVLRRRFMEVGVSGGEFLPLTLLRHFGLLGRAVGTLAGLVGVALFGMGAWRHRTHSAGLVVFALLNFGLLLVFAPNGGARYSFPLLIPIGILCGAGVGTLLHAPRVNPGLNRVSRYASLLEPVALSATIVGMAAISVVMLRAAPESDSSGPLTPASDSLFAYVRMNIPAEATVSFFKPRALRLFTDRLGIAITRPEHLDRADYVILDKDMEDAKWQVFWQVDRQAVEAYGGGKFGKVFETGQFIVYRAQRP